jgi:NAD(P)-dependent dehydrogenase (short-subunit alcohol dehydrogenase family)
MDGKVCIVTGASVGLGKITARELAKMGARVAIVCRDEARGKAALAEIKSSSGSEAIDLFLADLSLPAQIRTLAADLLAKYPKIHVLVNNAGLILSERELTSDGLEKTFATNHIGYFLLTHLLLERLKQSAPARIVSVSSGAHQMGDLDFDDLHSEKRYRRFFGGMRVYGTSKLYNILFTRELAQRLAGTGVTANCVHPGGVGTNFGQSATGIFKKMVGLAKPLLLTPEQGADTMIYLASSPEVEGKTGEYYYKRRITRTTSHGRDLEAAKRLWSISEQVSGVSA